MNAQGLAVERAAGRRLFSSLHAAFSFGAPTCAALAGLIAGLGVEPLAHLAGVAVLSTLASLAIIPGLLHDSPDGDRPVPQFARPSRRLALYALRGHRLLRSAGRRGGLRLERHLPGHRTTGRGWSGTPRPGCLLSHDGSGTTARRSRGEPVRRGAGCQGGRADRCRRAGAGPGDDLCGSSTCRVRGDGSGSGCVVPAHAARRRTQRRHRSSGPSSESRGLQSTRSVRITPEARGLLHLNRV